MLIRRLIDGVPGTPADVAQPMAEDMIAAGRAVKESDHLKMELSRLEIGAADPLRPQPEVKLARQQIEAALEHALASETDAPSER